MRFGGSFWTLRRLYACARIRRGDPAHAGRVHAVTGVRHPAGTGSQPGHLAGRSRQSALRAVRPQRRRSDWAAAPQDRARPQGAAAHRHRPRRGLSVRRADKDAAVRREAFDRSPAPENDERDPDGDLGSAAPPEDRLDTIGGRAGDVGGWREVGGGPASLWRCPVRRRHRPCPAGGCRQLVSPRRPPGESAPRPHLSIVVLPLAHFSGDPAQIISSTASPRTSPPSFTHLRPDPPSRANTAFTYKGRNVDAKKIGKELRGSIRARRLGTARPGPAARQCAAHRHRDRRAAVGRPVRRGRGRPPQGAGPGGRQIGSRFDIYPP